MFVFKNIDQSSTIIEQNVVNYTHTLNTSSAGIQSIKIVSGSISQSYWDSLNVLFFTSGSPIYNSDSKFEKPTSNLSIVSKGGTQNLNKFHGYPSCSIFNIPQRYYGEKIEEGTFVLTDNSKASINIKAPPQSTKYLNLFKKRYDN